MNKRTAIILWAFFQIAVWGLAPEAQASLSVFDSASETEVDETGRDNDAATLEGLRNLGSGVQVPPGTGEGDLRGDPFGDGIGLLAMGDGAAPSGDSAVPPAEDAEEDAGPKPPEPPKEVTFVPDEEGGGGKRIHRNGKGQIIIEQTVDADGNVTGSREFYPDSGAEKTVEEKRGNATVIHHYDPPKAGEKRGVERITEVRLPHGATKVTLRDPAGHVNSIITTSQDGSRSVTRVNPETGKQVESTSTRADGNLASALTYSKDGSASGTIFGPDGETTVGRVAIAPDGTKTTTNLNADGSVRDTTVHDKDGKLISQQTPNPDGTTSTTSFHPDGRQIETKVDNAAGETVRWESPAGALSGGLKIVTHLNPEDGSVRETTMLNGAGEVTRRETPNPDGSFTVETYSQTGQLLKSYTIHPGQ